MSNIKNLYAAEIAEALAALNSMEKGSKEYGDLVADIDKMTNRYNEMERADNDALNAEEAREFEKEKLEREAQATEKAREDERMDRIVRNVIAIGGIVVPAALYIWGAKTSWKWERTDTLTNTVGKETFKALFRLKK